MAQAPACTSSLCNIKVVPVSLINVQAAQQKQLERCFKTPCHCCGRGSHHLWHQVTIMIRPPGVQTRASSLTKRSLSGMCSPLSRLHTRSKEASANGCCSASATWNDTLSAKPCCAASALARAACVAQLRPSHFAVIESRGGIEEVLRG